jgi:hypothetical protein
MSITFSGTPGTTIGSQLQLIGSTSWSTNTSSVSFSYDTTLYYNLILYWWIDHSPNWTWTYLRFRNSSGDITTSDYSFSTEWQPTSAVATTPPTWKGATGESDGDGGLNKNKIWLAGNGAVFDSHGWAQIGTMGTYNDGSYKHYPHVRTAATLTTSPRTTAPTYTERGMGGCYIASNTITGLTVFGAGGASRRGYVTLVGFKRNPLS